MRISDWSSDVCSSDLKREKLAEADWLVTCTAFGAAHLRALAGRAGHVHLLYHGLDLDRFGEAAPGRSDRNGGDPGAPVRSEGVGSGTSWSVRVDTGGRRNLKKKNKQSR